MINLKKLCEEKGLTNLDIGEFSDGFHTFNSLYHQRLVLFAALVNTYPDFSWKTKRHSDGEECFGGGWFLVGINTPEGPYTYHYELKVQHGTIPESKPRMYSDKAKKGFFNKKLYERGSSKRFVKTRSMNYITFILYKRDIKNLEIGL